jgi:hypothetical protein
MNAGGTKTQHSLINFRVWGTINCEPTILCDSLFPAVSKIEKQEKIDAVTFLRSPGWPVLENST